MNRRTLTVGLVLLGVALVLVIGFFATFERKDVTESQPSHGEARYNRFFALQQMLLRQNLSVKSLTSLAPSHLRLTTDDTLLLGDDASRVDVDNAKRLAAWVRDGGHLLLSPGAAVSLHTPLFDALGLLDPHPAEFGCSTLVTQAHSARVKDDEPGAGVCGLRFRLVGAADAAVDASIGDAKQGYLFARTRLGKGTVSLLADFSPLVRNQLKLPAAQQFAWRLLQPNRGRGTIYLIYALDGPSFLKFLGLTAWPALLALAVLLAAWMAMRSARLGPLMPAPTLHRRALLEHVQAAGEFFYRRDGGRSLHRLASDTVLARLRRRDPACAMLNGDALYARLAERSALDPAHIAQAFQSPANAHAFRTSIITLARLRSRP
ncbi:hypothetical protein PY254_16370 [Rhodanobacter sp. AS-Z3]|uniref:DUF4350 domain-containing protein n=1 Tax=Rhodanobacter sp. AS-Z3 TaxID=3031330 RepID=UPI002478F482|nr:DUF4350 domain-containing protein [Rhodanobacter sp. AS-Z3]WEN14786.1 hypothetical protein PY254_16370 [Rhodanobacter sp. AS-Z3]